MTDPATEKQIEYIRSLGGIPKPGLTKEDASDLISRLKSAAPATAKQIGYLTRLGASFDPGITSEQASELISDLDARQPPTKQQVKRIEMLGGTAPSTKGEVSKVIAHLESSALATDEQKKRAIKLGVALPEDATFESANRILVPLEMDADEEDGKAPTKTQINKIVKLGGNPDKAVNNWRAEEYIEQLEEQRENFDSRVEEAIECAFDEFTRDIMSVRKPSKKIMAEALRYGDSQGWGDIWEDAGKESEYNSYTLLDAAIYHVAPELLKKGESPPRLSKSGARSTGGSGFAVLVIAAIIIFVLWKLLF